jgi:hypothetical protein
LSNKEAGLFPRYLVKDADGNDVPNCFVLDSRDPLAGAALATYPGDIDELVGYQVSRTDGKPTGVCYVLVPERDADARVTLKHYANAADAQGYHQLGIDLVLWVRRIESAK